MTCCGPDIEIHMLKGAVSTEFFGKQHHEVVLRCRYRNQSGTDNLSYQQCFNIYDYEIQKVIKCGLVTGQLYFLVVTL